MNDKEKILVENIKEYFNYAVQAYNSKNFNTATTLFFKALATLGDLFLLRNEGKIPSNHSERFRILQNKYKEIYNLLDKDFPLYQDSYNNRIDKETATVIYNDVKKLAERFKISL